MLSERQGGESCGSQGGWQTVPDNWTCDRETPHPQRGPCPWMLLVQKHYSCSVVVVFDGYSNGPVCFAGSHPVVRVRRSAPEQHSATSIFQSSVPSQKKGHHYNRLLRLTGCQVWALPPLESYCYHCSHLEQSGHTVKCARGDADIVHCEHGCRYCASLYTLRDDRYHG